MPSRVLTQRELNRTHLYRQHLLARSDMTTGDMLCAIVGLQAQEVKDPYLALWSRLGSFGHSDLTDMLTNFTAVRASLMRGTIHLVTAEDYGLLFPVTYALHQRVVGSVANASLVPREHHLAIIEQARAMLAEHPMTASQIGTALAESWPVYDKAGLSQVVRFLLPLIQMPPRGVWGDRISSNPVWALPHAWLDGSFSEEPHQPHEMIRRYLHAFGPASVPDITSWSGVTNLKSPVLDLGEELVTYTNEKGTVLYDLAGLEIVSGDEAAPVRFLPGFDNALLGHKDRSRIISDEVRALISTPNGVFSSTFLVDGFVAGIWRVHDDAVQLAALTHLSNTDMQAVEREAIDLAPFWTGHELPVAWVDIWKLPGKHPR